MRVHVGYDCGMRESSGGGGWSITITSSPRTKEQNGRNIYVCMCVCVCMCVYHIRAEEAGSCVQRTAHCLLHLC